MGKKLPDYEKSPPIRDDKFEWLHSVVEYFEKNIKPDNEWIQLLIVLTICITIAFVIHKLSSISIKFEFKIRPFKFKLSVR